MTEWSVRFQGKPFNITVIQVYALTSKAEEAEQFYEDLQDLLELTPPKNVLFIIGDCNAKVGSQETPGVTDKFWPRSDRQSAWWTMDGGSWHCTGDNNQDHPQEKEMKKSKTAVWGGLTNSCEKKGSEKQRKKERYTCLNAEFQRIARRDKKAFLRDHCKEIEENSRMGKTRGLFQKIRTPREYFMQRWAQQRIEMVWT